MNGATPFSPMLLSELKTPFHRPGWVYEEKYDGYRILAVKDGAQVTLWSRNGKDLTRWFRGIAKAVADLQARTITLDGEVARGVSPPPIRRGLLPIGREAARGAGPGSAIDSPSFTYRTANNRESSARSRSLHLLASHNLLQSPCASCLFPSLWRRLRKSAVRSCSGNQIALVRQWS